MVATEYACSHSPPRGPAAGAQLTGHPSKGLWAHFPQAASPMTEPRPCMPNTGSITLANISLAAWARLSEVCWGLGLIPPNPSLPPFSGVRMDWKLEGPSYVLLFPSSSPFTGIPPVDRLHMPGICAKHILGIQQRFYEQVNL